MIDDEVDLGRMVKINLEKDGHYQVDTLADPLEGFEKIKAADYDLILLDVLMPAMSGFKLVEKIRELGGRIGTVPIVVISGKKTMEDLFHSSDIHSFIIKPFEIAELINAIESACAKPRNFEGEDLAMAQINGQGRKVVLSGVEDFVVCRIRDYLEQRGFVVAIGVGEEDTLRQAESLKSEYIICQFWDDRDKFNTVEIYRDAKNSSVLKKSRFLVFCKDNISLEAAQYLPKDSIIAFHNSPDLMQKLGRHLMRS